MVDSRTVGQTDGQIEKENAFLDWETGHCWTEYRAIIVTHAFSLISFLVGMKQKSMRSRMETDGHIGKKTQY